MLSSTQDIDVPWRSDTARDRLIGWWRCLTCDRAVVDPQSKDAKPRLSAVSTA